MSVVEEAAAPQAAEAAPLLVVDAQHPWLGLDSFSEETRGFFYGRDEEIAELARRVQRKTLTVLFGQSGLGKTSILRAGLVPRLRRDGFCPVYVRIDYARESPPPAEQIKQAIFRATETAGHWSRPGAATEGETLWEFLHHRGDVLADASGRTLVPLLIFDQFEEIFTLAQDDDFGRRRAAEFLDDLADLVEGRLPAHVEALLDEDDGVVERFDFERTDYRILLALREDYLAHLEAFKSKMPSITQNRMRLARMTGEQALVAVTRPGGTLVSQEVAEAIVRFVAGGAELRNAEVEPALLSLVCRELNNARVAQGRAEISADVLDGSNESILAEFYERALADQPAGVRAFVEDEMLTESGFRESLAEERVRRAFADAGAPAGALGALVNRRLLRIEERLDLRRVELTHDVLCPVVRASRNRRHEREEREATERELAGQREREVAARHALVRARRIAIGASGLAVVAIAGAIFGYVNMQRARDAEARATAVRSQAETARTQAEGLIVYLLDDFYQELEPVGRLDIVSRLSKRAIDYYAALPPELRSDESERTRALALVRYGYAQRYMNRNDEAQKSLDEAIAVLRGLRSRGDATETAAIGLALGVAARGRVYDNLNQRDKSTPLAKEGLAILEPLYRRPDASVAVRRAYAQNATYAGFVQMRDNDSREAIATLEEARKAWRSIDGLKLEDLSAAVGFAEATSWQVNAFEQLGLVKEGTAAAEEGRRIAEAVLAQRPNHMGALRSHGLLTSALGWSALRRGDPETGLRMGALSKQDWNAYLAMDSGNFVARSNLGVATGLGVYSLWALGRSQDALNELHVALAALAGKQLPALMAENAVEGVNNGRVWAADLREPSLEADFAKALGPFTQAARAPLGERTIVRVFAEGDLRARYQREEAAGDFAAMLATAEASRDRLAKMPRAETNEGRLATRLLAFAQLAVATAHLHRQEWQAAEAAARGALRTQASLPAITLEAQGDAMEPRIVLAIALGRLGKRDEAREVLAPALAFHRGMVAGKITDMTEWMAYGYTLYAQALADPANARALLAETQAVIDRFPPQMAKRNTVRRFAEAVAQERARKSGT